MVLSENAEPILRGRARAMARAGSAQDVRARGQESELAKIGSISVARLVGASEGREKAGQGAGAVNAKRLTE
eukprot:9471098-Pyramimonas_sp.AAC.1